MSRETERIFRLVEEHFKDREFENQEDYSKAIDEFLEPLTNIPQKRAKKDAWDYLDMAYEAGSIDEALKYAKKALKMNKELLDAEVMISEITSESIEELKKNYEILIERTQMNYKEKGLFDAENIGRYWSIIETRPYMRLRYNYIRLLMDMGKYRKAAKHCEELLELCEGDNVGARYLLMGLYAFLEDEASALRLHKRFQGEKSLAMILPFAVMYYKLDDEKKAKKYLNQSIKININVVPVLNMLLQKDGGFLEESIGLYGYRMGSAEEVMSVITGTSFLYTFTPEFIEWIIE